MNIGGLQKMTLLDYPGCVAATVFLTGCDFRCPFCHNAQLITGAAKTAVTMDEFKTFLEKRTRQLDGICITGGEPCLNRDLLDFAKMIKSYRYKVKLDTNGNHPDMLKVLIQNQCVNYIAMDIKSSLSGYPKAIGIPKFDTSKIEESIEIIMTSGIDYEFRTTVVKGLHNDNDFVEIGKMIRGAKAYFLQQFIMREDVPDKTLSSPDIADLKRYKEILLPAVPKVTIRGISEF